jgi:FtsX-like permease family
MALIASWLRLELRRRWRSLAVLALLVALSTGLVVSALAGARRGASAIERLQDHTRPATSAIFTNSANFEWEKIRALPEVEALTTFVIDYTLAWEDLPDGVSGFPPTDAETLRSIETPVIFDGRMWNPSRADEVVVTPVFASHFHKHVGDTLMLDLPTPRELAEGDGSGPDGAFTGPRLPMTIVGIVRSPWMIDEPGAAGFIEPSPGLAAQYPANTVGAANSPKNLWNFVSALVRLRGGEADLPQFRADVARVSHRTDIEVWNLPGQMRAAQREGTFEALSLLAFGLAAFIAAAFLVGQAIARYASATTTDLRMLRAIGVTPAQAIAAATAAPTLAGAVGGVVGVISAFLASPLFPLGTAKLAEPAPGYSADWVVFGPALALAALLAAGGAAAGAWFGLAAARRAVSPRRSTVARAAARWGLPVPVMIGTRFALERGHGRTSVPVRPALVGAVVGVLGVVASFTFSHGVSDVVSHPERLGQTHQLEAFIGANDQDFLPADRLIAVAAHEPKIAGLDDARQAVAAGPTNRGSIPLYDYTGGPKAIPVVLFSGRLPASPNEIMLAPRTLDAQDVGVGDRIVLTGDRGRATYTITGSGLVPEGPRNSYAEGGWITTAGYDRLFSGFLFHIVLASVNPGVDIDGAIAALRGDIGKAIPEARGYSFSRPDPPIEVAEIRAVRVLPIVLGAFLAILAAGAVGHVLATAVRRRRQDVAVLRALGMTRSQSRWVVVTQASVLAVIGVLFGLPLGLAFGRIMWRSVADYTPLQYVPPTAMWALLVVGPAALVVANVLAAIPGRRAARMQISQILRAE